MIVFCEDCGHKNQIYSAHIVQGRAVFICRACGYHNAYLLSVQQQKKQQENALAHLFQALDQDPQMVGGFVYDMRKGITTFQMPALLLPEDIQSLGGRLAQGFDQGLLGIPDICAMTVMISDKYFFITKKDEGAYLVFIALTPDLPEPFHRFFMQWREKE